MDEVFINQEADPYVLDADGTLDVAALQLQPATVVINGKKGLVDVQTSKTKRTLAELQEKILRDETAGSITNPLRISGALLAGCEWTIVTLYGGVRALWHTMVCNMICCKHGRASSLTSFWLLRFLHWQVCQLSIRKHRNVHYPMHLSAFSVAAHRCLYNSCPYLHVITQACLNYIR